MSAVGDVQVLVITQLYAPEPNFITQDVATVAAATARVAVVTTYPSYPSGRFPAGVRWWRISHSIENGVEVWRVPSFPDHSNSVWRRAMSYMTFTVAAAIVAPFVAPRAQVAWIYQTPFTVALAALPLKILARTRLVYTSADLWPESFTAAGMVAGGALMKILYAYRRWINRKADMIVCSTRSTLECFASEGIPRDRLAYIPVWVSGIPEPLPEQQAEQRPVIIYVGNLGPAQQLETIIRGARILEDAGTRFQIQIVGSGSSERSLRDLANDLELSNVAFTGRVTPEEAYGLSTQAFAQIVSLRRAPLFDMTVPSKLFFCMAAGAPILAGLHGEAAEVAIATGGAIAFDTDSPTSFAAAVQQLASTDLAVRDEMRQCLRSMFARNFSRSALLREYANLFATV